MDMNTKKKALVYIMIASMIASLPIKSGLGATGSYYPTETDDDGFITVIGNHFRDTPYLRLRSPTTDIINGLRFRSLNIPQDAKINNATLFVRTFHTYDAGLVLSTIYGVNENDAYAFATSGDFTRPYTTNHVVWNVTDVNGNSWHNVSVTAIVQEIISRYGWRSGNDLAFIILADSGEPRREFASFDNNIIYRPRLDITYDVTPSDPSTGADPPYNDTDLWTWELNDTYRGFDIWTVTNANRTGSNMDLNWATLNITDLTEVDAGGYIAQQNDTYAIITGMAKFGTSCFYNDTGSASISDGFFRFKVNVTAVNNAIASNEVIPGFFGISTATPLGEAGLPYGGSGNGGYLIAQVNVDDVRWRFLIIVRTGVANAIGGTSIWYNEGSGDMLYMEVYFNDDDNYFSWWRYSDETYSTLVEWDRIVNTFFNGPFRYAMITESLGQAGGSTISHRFYTFLEDIEIDSFTFITYPNGTLVDPDPITEDPKDYIDDILGGADPEDPETDKYGDALTKNRWKTFVFVIGMLMFLGTPTFAIMARVSTGRWIMVLFVSLCGLSILWSLIYM